MRFAITGTDRYLGIFEAFVRAGWQPVKLFTVPVGPGGIETNHAMIALAEKHGASVQVSRMTEDDLAHLGSKGCDALIVASYKWRIGSWEDYLKYAVNFHSSPLPDGRGPYPMVRAIIEQRPSWGMTCHKISGKFDRGDILAAQDFPMTPDESYESLDLKIQIAGLRLASKVAQDLPHLWDAAQPQGPGTYWPLWTDRQRAIDFNQPVDAVLRHVRAFGPLESLTSVNGRWLSVRRAVGWIEDHSAAPGMAVHVNNRTIVIAAADGYIGLVEWSFTDEDTMARLGTA